MRNVLDWLIDQLQQGDLFEALWDLYPGFGSEDETPQILAQRKAKGRPPSRHRTHKPRSKKRFSRFGDEDTLGLVPLTIAIQWLNQRWRSHKRDWWRSGSLVGYIDDERYLEDAVKAVEAVVDGEVEPTGEPFDALSAIREFWETLEATYPIRFETADVNGEPGIRMFLPHKDQHVYKAEHAPKLKIWLKEHGLAYSHRVE